MAEDSSGRTFEYTFRLCRRRLRLHAGAYTLVYGEDRMFIESKLQEKRRSELPL
jgi:hypothetical protein